jgi:hypothetical protein
VAIVASVDRNDGMKDVLDDVVRQLVISHVDGGEGFISMPMLFPGGAPVVVHVRRDGDDFIVTDQGKGYLEAEVIGAAAIFARVAKQVAASVGIEFDGHMVFAARVPRDWLPNAVIFVATASRNAVQIAAERLSADIEETLRGRLKSALRDVFRSKAAFDVTIAGASSKGRNFAAMVQTDGRTTLFDVVTPSPVSVSFAIVKFEDVALLESRPRGIALAAGKVDGPDQTILSKWARVVPFNDNHEFLKEAA